MVTDPPNSPGDMPTPDMNPEHGDELTLPLAGRVDSAENPEDPTVDLDRKSRAACSRQETSVRPPLSADMPDVLDAAGRYQLDGEIARGGVGIVFKGRDTFLGRDVAVKVVQQSLLRNAEVLWRFDREARITARLQHPGIIPVYEMGHLPDMRPYFIMKMVTGRTLNNLLAERQERAPDLMHFLQIFEQVCQTLAYAHAGGVIHRDLKPPNVMVGAFGEVYVMDWGLAKSLGVCAAAPEAKPIPNAPEVKVIHRVPVQRSDYLDPADSLTESGSVLGTLSYMPPEQAGGEIDRLDQRADVFGLGGILCAILTGRPTYVGKDNAERHSMALRGDLAETYARLDGCGTAPELIRLAKRCLAADRNDRPRDAAELERELAVYLESVLRQPERDLVRFFELSLDLFCIANLDGYFRRVNSNFSRVLGYSSEELVSRPFLDFVHIDDRERTLAEMAKLSEGLPVVQFRNRYRDNRGAYRWFEWMAKSIPEERVIFAVARDVTDQVSP
jgi:serine/threonine-protein kinase